MKDTRQLVSDYVFHSRYSQIIPSSNGEGYQKETWEEAVKRVEQVHKEKLRRLGIADRLFKDEDFCRAWKHAFDFYQQKKVLGSQRLLQFGNDRLFEHEARVYNCTASYIDRVDFFKELMFLLLNGCGCGYSVQNVHTRKLPEVIGIKEKKVTFTIPDNIEGWATAVDMLISSYFNGTEKVVFDYSLIRPAGAPIMSGGFKAPGPHGLRTCLQKIDTLLRGVRGRKLTNFELHRIACLVADCVISGGVRRAALICLFDIEDEEMKNCKTGEWWAQYPELARCNNSVAVLPSVTKQQFMQLKAFSREYGEPGIVFLPSNEYVCNPCVEVMGYPVYEMPDGEKQTGWIFCNLTEINGALSSDEDVFYDQCRAATFLGTLQALYTNFGSPITETTVKIVQRDSLLGVGLDGMADNPELLFDPEVQRTGARIVREYNEWLVELIDLPILNPAARATVVKPSGNSSQLLGCASGIHSYHFKRYIRYIQANKNETLLNAIKRKFPTAVQPAFGETEAIAFPIELPETVLIQEENCVPFLERIAQTKINWINTGQNKDHPEYKKHPLLHMNVSCTVQVAAKEWDECFNFVWEHKNCFGGISFLGKTGDLEYRQAPYTSVLYEDELVAQYGRGIIFSSGLITDSQSVFRDIYEACDAALGRAKHLLKLSDDEISRFVIANIKNGVFLAHIDGLAISDMNAVLEHLRHQVDQRIDWVRRFKKFANNYFDGDLVRTSHALKHVNNLHYWQQLQNWPDIEFKDVEITQEQLLRETPEEVACAGGACEI
jgi:ribonucleoside-diphosphate reductase alpha chain